MRTHNRYFSHITPFTKIEKMSVIKKYKAPRMIQGRHFTFNIKYGKFIKPMEKIVSKYNTETSKYFGKGDYDTQARKIRKLATKYRYYTECDHTSFDAHVTMEHLEMTHKFYKACIPKEYHAELTELMNKTKNNKCYSRNGESYKIKGTRMSGDVDTGFGNCLINYAILKDGLERLNMEGEVIVNGDDSIIFTNKPINTADFNRIMRDYNMESKAQESVKNINTVEFCRTKLVTNYEGQDTMMMDPDRLVDIYGMEYKITKAPKYHKYLLETATCNAIINANNPVGYIWGKHFNIDTVGYIKDETKFDKMFEELEIIEKDKMLKLANFKPERTTTGEITPSMITAYPQILEYDNKIKSLAEKVIKHNYVFKSSTPNIIINHDTQTATQY
nr:MAG: hypothetical protein 2 [XiangYun tombus-noda-like virus 3]